MRPVLITSEQRPLACETPGKRRPIPPRLADREMETLSDSFCGLVIRIPEVHLHDKVPKKKNTIQKLEPPYSKKFGQKNYDDATNNQNPEIEALDSVNKILKFGRMPHYRAWSKLLPAFVGQINPIETPLKIAEEIPEVSREVGGEGFEDATALEILELVSPQEENLEIEDLEQIVDATKIENVPDTEEEPPTVQFGASSIIKVMTVLQDIIDKAMNHDPVMS
uniref:Uncharacterized protein n=1 Tax=Trichogramma kaykai TaxID=54128 RepID=A0ABD2VY33_9HYME